MSLEAIIEQPTAVERAAVAIGKTTGNALELLVKAGYNGLCAANPIRDARNFLSSAYHLVKDKWSWKSYKANLRKGKFLGKGNLANVLFTTGIVASGMYPGLLALRAGIGAGSYLAKRALTTEPVKKRAVGFLDRHKRKASWLGKYILGVPRDKTEQYLQEKKLNQEFSKLKNDNYYRKKVLPAVLDAAIAAKGYAGLVGLKWLAGAAGNAGESLKKSSESRIVRALGGLASKAGNFTKNASSDMLSALVFAAGAGHMYETGAISKSLNGTYYEDTKDRINYFIDGKAAQDTKDYFSSGQYKNDVAVAVSGTADSLAKFVKDKFQSAQEVIKNPVAAVINPQDKYAVLVTGYSIEHDSDGSCCERFIAEQCQVYKDLLDMGYKPENIKVLVPGGLHPVNPDSEFPDGFQELKKAYSDTSYSHEATEKNLEKVLAEMGTKVDGNDTFVFYLGSHGNRSYNWNTGEYSSHVGLNNGTEVMDDHELFDYVKPINGKKEFYFVDACHSAGFADQAPGKDGIWVAACQKDQPAVMYVNGDSLGSYLVEELKQNGGINNETSYAKVKSCLTTALDKFRESWKGRGIMGYIWAQDQKPVMVENSQRSSLKGLC